MHLQWCVIEFLHILHKPVIDEIDLSNEVLNIHFGQGATKISEVKVGGLKISAGSAEHR